MTPSFNVRQLLSFVKSITNGRDVDSAVCVEHAVPIKRVEAKKVAMAKGQEERSAAMPREHGTPELVHREVTPIGRLRRTYNLDSFSSDRAMEFASFRGKLPGVQVILAHVLGPIGGEGTMGGARHGVF